MGTTIPYSGRGYITKKYLVTKKTYDYIKSLTKDIDLAKGLNQDSTNYHRFLAHLFVSTVSVDQETSEGFIPIYSRLIEKEFGRDFDVFVLKDLDLIDIKPHRAGLSTEYRLKPAIFRKAFKMEERSVRKAWNSMVIDGILNGWARVNLMNGVYDKSSKNHKFVTDDGFTLQANIPPIVIQSIKALKPCPFKPKKAGDYINALEKKYISEKKNFRNIKKTYPNTSNEYLVARKEYLKARGRYTNDRLSQIAILNQFPKPIQNIFEYQAAYKIQVSGRISEINGGFQSASRMVKYLLLADLPVYNYDLKNSQAAILLQEMKYAKINCKWLEDYLKDPDFKHQLAKKIGIKSDDWKKCFYALIMGAEAENTYGDIYKTISALFNKNQAEKAHKKLLYMVDELILATDEWRDYLLKTEDKRYTYLYKNIKYWKNACGMKFKQFGMENKILKNNITGKICDKKEIKKVKRKLAAFVLQGQEASFIHHLTVLCDKKNIPVYKNEHDGLITGELIPIELVVEASEKSGFQNPKLEHKPLCEERKQSEMKEYINQAVVF